jgi:hypothetical protein
MKIFPLVSVAICMVNATAFADIDAASIQIDQPSKSRSSSSDQLLTLQFEQFRPQSVQIDNGSYAFDYGKQISSFLGEVGWAGKLVDFHGSFYFEENLAFSTFTGNISRNSGGAQPSLGSSSYSLYLFGLDTRLMYAADWFPAKWLIPFIDGGYQYTAYYQPASTGLESVQGGVGNFVSGGGMRFWLNRRSSLENGNNPIYLSAKYNKIFNSASSLNLASSSVLGGMSLGF